MTNFCISIISSLRTFILLISKPLRKGEKESQEKSFYADEYTMEIKNSPKAEPYEITGKKVKDVEAYLERTGSIQKLFQNLKGPVLALLIVATIVLLSSITLFSTKHESLALQKRIYELENENALLKSQLAAPENADSNPAESKTTNKITYYEIKQNDCIEVISSRFYGSEKYAAGLARLNGLTTKSTLQVGQILQVPDNPEDLKTSR